MISRFAINHVMFQTPTLFIAVIALVAPFIPVEIEVLAYKAYTVSKNI